MSDELGETLDLMLTETDLAFWEANGFWVSRHGLDHSTVDELRTRVDGILSGRSDRRRNALKNTNTSIATKDELIVVDNIHWADGLIESIASNHAIGELAAHLLGSSVIRLWGTQLIFKNPSNENLNSVKWHRDIDFWRCVNRPKLLTVWIALDDMKKENGCLEYAAGSHLPGHRQIEDCSSFPRFKAEINAGQVAIHHCLTLHGSGINSSDVPRRAIAIHLMDGFLHYVEGSDADNHINVILNGGVPGKVYSSEYFPVVYGK